MTRFSRIMAVILVILVLADLWLVRIAHITGLEHQFVIWYLCGPLALPQAYTIWRRLDRLSSLFCCVQWSLLSQAALMPLIIAAGRSPAPLADPLLAHIDGLMHFSTPSVIGFIRSNPVLVRWSHLAYVTANPMIALAIIGPALAGKKKDSEYFVLAGTFATLLTAALFAVLPAVGPWVSSGFVPAPDQAEVEHSVTLLKTARDFALTTGISAVISFPSFHVILALLCGIALWGFKRLRVITAAITVAICISVITTGWHYLTDVFGGIGVVLVSDYITRRWLLDRELRRT
jgi:hypothetical protein